MAASLILGILTVSVPVQASTPVQLRYSLPKTVVGFGAAYTIEACPEGNTPLKVSTVVSIKPVNVAGDTVVIDASAGFLVKRSVTMTYYENGTIKAFNGESTGQGGEFAASLVKALGFVGSIPFATANMPERVIPEFTPECQTWVKALLDEVRRTQDNLALLEDQAAGGKASEALLAQIETHRTRVTELRAALTIASKPKTLDPADRPDGASELLGRLEAADFSPWFTNVDDFLPRQYLAGYGIPGLTGFVISVSGTAATKGQGDIPAEPDGHRSLLYRDPVGMVAEIKPIAEQANWSRLTASNDIATALLNFRAASKRQSVQIAHIGEVRSIPFTGSGIFGNRVVTADFSENGRATKVSYSSSSGGAAIAGVFDASVEALTALRDAEAAALARRLAQLQNQQALDDLIEQSAKAEEEVGNDGAGGEGAGGGDDAGGGVGDTGGGEDTGGEGESQ